MNNEPPVQIKLTVASFSSRAMAYVIDSLIAGFLTALLVQLFMGEAIHLWINTYVAAIESQTTPPMPPAAVLLFHAAAFGVYSVLGWVSRGSTLGQRLLGIRIMQLKNAQRLSLNQAALRFAVLYGVVTIAGPFSIVILAVPMLNNPAKRALHDLAAGSVVVNAKADTAASDHVAQDKPSSNSREF